VVSPESGCDDDDDDVDRKARDLGNGNLKGEERVSLERVVVFVVGLKRPVDDLRGEGRGFGLAEGEEEEGTTVTDDTDGEVTLAFVGAVDDVTKGAVFWRVDVRIGLPEPASERSSVSISLMVDV
jgi:hypothetical protein